MPDDASEYPNVETRPKRRLLPAVAPRSTPPLVTRSTAVYPRRRTTVSLACDNCRKAKTKCSGERPICRRCGHHKLPCHFAGQPGETPAKALKRDIRSLRDKAASQAKILELLAELPEHQAQDVFHRIRAGVPLETICNQVTAGDATMQLAVAPESRFRYKLLYQSRMPEIYTHNNPYLATLLYESASLYQSQSPGGSSSTLPHSPEPNLNSVAHKSAYLMPFHAALVVEPLLSDVKPSSWTMIISSRTMASGDTDFCSALLVNAVLAYCCICYPSLPERAEYWNPQNLTYRFLAEAKRLWELEAREPRLTTIHAGVILNVFHNLSGLDEIGQAYRLNSIALAHQLRLFDGPVQGKSERVRSGTLFTAWSLYSWESLTAFSFQKSPQLNQPPVMQLPDSETYDRWYGEIWIKYPSDRHPTPSHFGDLFKAKAKFRIIMQRFCLRAHRSDVKVPLKEAYGFHTELLQWRDGLPPSLHARNIVLPAHLQLHIYLQHLILAIFEPLLDEVVGAELQHYPRARDIVAEAMRNLQTLIRLYYLRHGYEAMDLFLVIPLILVGFRCLDRINNEISRSELDLTRTTLMLVVNGLYYQRRNHYLAEALYRVVRGRMRPEEVLLARDAGAGG